MHVLVLLCWLGSLRHLEGVLSLVLSFELSSLICVPLALLEPLPHVSDQVLKVVERLNSKLNLNVLCGKICSCTLHSCHLLLCDLKFVLDFNFLCLATRHVLSSNFKSAIFVDRESALNLLLHGLHRLQLQVKLSNLLVVDHMLVFTLVDVYVENLLVVSTICELFGLFAWNWCVRGDEHTH